MKVVVERAGEEADRRKTQDGGGYRVERYSGKRIRIVCQQLNECLGVHETIVDRREGDGMVRMGWTMEILTIVV